jgi:serine/threonine-protein kinase HipA
LLRVLDDMPRRPMLAGEQDMRLSLAGAQDKLPVVAQLEAGQMHIGLPRFGSPSTHILKPTIPGVTGSVFNEGFCLALARALKLDVANAAIHGPTDHAYLLVERYDRQRITTGQLVRLHQEDFCQALGLPPETKYQNEGGPGLAQAFALLRRATRPSAPHVLKLLDFVIFNTLVGNHDAHSKNFSLLYTPHGAVLAPLYDVLSTAVYPQLTDKMAMKIGSKYKFSELEARHWAQFAVDAGLTPALVKKRILDIARRLPLLARSTQSAFAEAHPIVGQIVTLIDQRCALTTRRLTGDSAA